MCKKKCATVGGGAYYIDSVLANYCITSFFTTVPALLPTLTK